MLKSHIPNLTLPSHIAPPSLLAKWTMLIVDIFSPTNELHFNP